MSRDVAVGDPKAVLDSSVRSSRPFHQYAEIFPLIDGPDLRAFEEAVRADGIRSPIVLLDGRILDGRNRYLAGIAAGIAEDTMPFREFGSAPGDGDDPIRFVVRENGERRHLTNDQRRMAAAKAANLPPYGPKVVVPTGAGCRPRCHQGGPTEDWH